MSVLVRPAREADFLAIRGGLPPWRCRAWTGEVDGVPVAVGGLILGGPPAHGRAMVFLDGAASARRYPVTLHRTARHVLGVARAMGLRTLALAPDRRQSRAEAWARRLGFEPSDDAGVWLCRV